MDEPGPPDRLHPDLRFDFGCTLTGALVLFGGPGIGVLAVVASLPRKTGWPMRATFRIDIG